MRKYLKFKGSDFAPTLPGSVKGHANFECHITVQVKDAAIATDVAGALHWKTSEIKRDPVLGDASHFYLTTHSDAADVMQARMCLCVSTLTDFGVRVIREKVELIIFDARYPRKADDPSTTGA